MINLTVLILGQQSSIYMNYIDRFFILRWRMCLYHPPVKVEMR